MTLNTKISRLIFAVVCLFSISGKLHGQTSNDSTDIKRWNFHFQNTTIYQYHPSFGAKYSGVNSLNHEAEGNTSITGTMFFGVRLWTGASAYFDPEISGGNGFSKTLGVAGFPNGEV